MQKATLIYNPKAGRVNFAKQTSRIVEFWRRRGWLLDVQPTRASGHAMRLAHDAALAGHRLVLAGGGDGTIGEVANGLVGTDTILAPMPMGTTNSFARELKMAVPTTWERHRLDEVLVALSQGRVYGVDVGFNKRVGENGRFWLMWSGVGIDSFLVHELEPRPAWSRRLGRVGYTLQGLAALPQFHPIHAKVSVDNHTIEDEFLLVEIANCRLYAGLLPFNPGAKLDDGYYEVRLFRGRTISQIFAYGINLLRHKPLPDDQVITLKGQSVVVETKVSRGCHADGEQAGFTPLISEIRKQSLRLLVPDSAPSDLFLERGEPFT